MLHDMDYIVLNDAPDWLRTEPVIVEVGANTGEWTAEAVHRLDPCALIAFEPQAVAYRQLTERMLDNPQVTCLLAAAGAEEGRGLLHASGDLVDVRASLHSRRDTHRKERVNVRPIDEVLGEWSVPRIDFLKIDAEGYELEVLKGARRYLEIGITMVQFEFNDMARDAGVKWRDIYELLLGLGYLIFQAHREWPEQGPDEPPWIDCDYVARRP